MRNSRTNIHLRRTASTIAAMTVAITVSLSAPTSAAGFESAAPDERAAIRVRVLQSDMMIAALGCGLRPQYNDAVRRFQAELVLHGSNLRGYFDRVHGKRARAELDRFVTALANQASSRSIGLGSRYCESAAQLMTSVLALPPSGLAEFSKGVVDLADIRVPTSVDTAARGGN